MAASPSSRGFLTAISLSVSCARRLERPGARGGSTVVSCS